MPSKSDYNFPPGRGQTGLDSLRVKQALIDQFLPSAINNVVNGVVQNPSFYESVAKVIASSYLPFKPVREGDTESAYVKGLTSINESNTDDKAFNYTLDNEEVYNAETFSEENAALFKSANIIPNIQFVSNYTQINFFDANDNVETAEIVIDAPISSMSYSYSNKFSDSSPVGYNGTIKELMGTSNLKITIQGVFTARYLGFNGDRDTTLNMPNLHDFQRMCMRNKIVTIKSDLIAKNTILNEYFEDCVIKSFSLPQDTTSKNLQRFSLVLESDKPLNIE